jgi:ribA/ribD-fused uncharacterized protein
MINSFMNEHRFLSNFWYVDIVYDNVYKSVEHFFQAMKTLDEGLRATIAMADTPGLAKKLGKTVPLRADWDKIKVSVMALGLCKKFSYPELAQKLIATYPHDLIEGNYWGDEIWGVNLKTGKGLNHLGKLLVMIRTNLINGIPILPDNDPVF